MTSSQPQARPTVETADRVAQVAASVPGVAALHPGRFGEAATYLPGRRVPGVQVRDDLVEVHVTLVWGVDVLATADAVRAATAAVVDRPVHVTVEDVLAPGEPAPPTAGAPNP